MLLTWRQRGWLTGDRKAVLRVVEQQVTHLRVFQPCILRLQQYVPDFLRKLWIVWVEAGRRLPTRLHGLEVQVGDLNGNPQAWGGCARASPRPYYLP